VVVKVEAVDGRPGLQTREFEAAFDRTLVAIFDLAIDEGFQGLRQAEIFSRSVSQHLVQMVAHRGQIQLL